VEQIHSPIRNRRPPQNEDRVVPDEKPRSHAARAAAAEQRARRDARCFLPPVNPENKTKR